MQIFHLTLIALNTIEHLKSAFYSFPVQKVNATMLGVLLVFVLTISVWLITVFYRRVVPVERRYFSKATIAKNAIPVLDRYISANTEIWVTGGDGRPLYEKDYPWTPDFLAAWVKMGCTVHYLLATPDDKALVELQSLGAKYAGRLQVETIDWSKAPADGAAREQLEEMKTFHFLLTRNPSLMWIERYHAAGTCEAVDCEFVSPSHLTGDERYGVLKSLYQDISDHYAVPLPHRQSNAA